MTTLLCMGFSDAAAIRKALRLAKNDINEAVALLTNERPGLHYGGYEPMESGQGPPGGHGSPAGGQGPRGGDGDGGGGGGGFDPPPAYHEVVETEVSCGPVVPGRWEPPAASPLPGLGGRGSVRAWDPRSLSGTPGHSPGRSLLILPHSLPAARCRARSLRSLQGEAHPGLSLAFQECVATVGLCFSLPLLCLLA